MKYCVTCGTTQNQHWKFCPHCGQIKVSYTAPATGVDDDSWAHTEPVLIWAPAPPAADASPIQHHRPETVVGNRRAVRAAEKRHTEYEQQRLRALRKEEKQATRRAAKQNRNDSEPLPRVTDDGVANVVHSVPVTPGATSGEVETVREPRRRRITALVLLMLLLVGGLTAGTWFGVRALVTRDAYNRTVEMAKLLDGIEDSERVMTAWQEETEVALGANERLDLDETTAIEEIAADHLAKLQSNRSAFGRDGGLSIPSWHGLIREARDRYVMHNDVWMRYLKAVARDGRELENMEALLRIDSTFGTACRSLGDVTGEPGFPNRSASNSRRIQSICRDASTLQPV